MPKSAEPRPVGRPSDLPTRAVAVSRRNRTCPDCGKVESVAASNSSPRCYSCGRSRGAALKSLNARVERTCRGCGKGFTKPRSVVDGPSNSTGNFCTHPEEQIAALVGIIADSGFTNPLLIEDDGTIIAGHGRLAAAERLGMAEVPCIRVTGLSPAQIKALRLSDNAVGLRSAWDEDILRAEIEALAAEDFNLDLIGFDTDELDALLNPPTVGRSDPDDVPEAPEIPVTQTGDVWLLGGHRIICGDSTAPDVVSALLGDVRPHLMVTDPPYGVEYEPDWRNQVKRAGTMKAIGAASLGKVDNDDRMDWRAAWDLFPGEVAYVWCASLHIHEVAESLIAGNFQLRASIIWRKQTLVIGRGHYHWQHEPCWYAVRKGGKGHWSGDRKQSSVWDISTRQGYVKGAAGDEHTGHSTQKPVECMKRPIENNSKPGDAVYEPFSGSGTTIIAAEMTGRWCFAIELNPAYVDVAVLRWEAFADRSATLESTGQTFREVSDERRLAAKAA